MVVMEGWEEEDKKTRKSETQSQKNIWAVSSVTTSRGSCLRRQTFGVWYSFVTCNYCALWLGFCYSANNGYIPQLTRWTTNIKPTRVKIYRQQQKLTLPTLCFCVTWSIHAVALSLISRHYTVSLITLSFSDCCHAQTTSPSYRWPLVFLSPFIQ